jgi:hypothetical protein
MPLADPSTTAQRKLQNTTLPVFSSALQELRADDAAIVCSDDPDHGTPRARNSRTGRRRDSLVLIDTSERLTVSIDTATGNRRTANRAEHVAYGYIIYMLLNAVLDTSIIVWSRILEPYAPSRNL